MPLEAIGGQRMQALRMSQIVARLLYCDCDSGTGLNEASPRISRAGNKLTSLHGENGKRYQLHHPASMAKAMLAGTYPYEANILIHHPDAGSDYNNGATLIVAGCCVYIFPPNLQFGEAGGDAHV